MDRKLRFLVAQFLPRPGQIHALGGVLHIRPLRGLALRRAEKWLLERLEMSDGLGAIYPAMLNAIVALRCLGYPEDHPQVIRARANSRSWGSRSRPPRDRPSAGLPHAAGGLARLGHGPGGLCLGEAGVPRSDPRMVKAADWLLSKEVRHMGDWAVKVPGTEPSGWYFEFNNEFYPDTDDTAQVLLALSKGGQPPRAATRRRRRSAPSSGSSPCSAATAAGAASTRTARR
jgi:squalene-hopene/tetraprenyl-beta-curcumene cyclase